MNRAPPAAPRPIRESLQEYGRGIAGGLLFSLPLMYTMEMWWTGFLAAAWQLAAYMGVTFLLLLGYNRYAGMHQDATRLEIAIDSIEEMGIGFVTAALVLILIGRITPDMPLGEIMGKIVVASMTVAIGVSVGTAQLGAGESPNHQDDSDAEPDLWGQLVLAACGATLFAANVAPTEEIVVIGIETSPWKLLGLAGLSLLVGALVLFYSGFAGADRYVRRDGFYWITLGLISSYAISLMISAVMLWLFGRFSGLSAEVAIAETIVLGLPAMLGASAGRLLIQ